MIVLFLSIITIEMIKTKKMHIRSVEKWIIFAVFLYVYLFFKINAVDKLYAYRIIYILPYLILCSYIDIRKRFVFDIDVFSGIIVNVINVLIQILWMKHCGINIYFDMFFFLIGMLSSFLLSFFIVRITKSMGEGDILVFTLAGSAGGILNTLFLYSFSFFMAGIFCMLKILIGDMDDKAISFVPFITAGFILTAVAKILFYYI